MNKDFLKQIGILLLVGLIGTLFLIWLSPSDTTGAFADAALKFFYLAIKLTVWSFMLKLAFGYLKFDEIYKAAEGNPGLLSIATSIIILAFSLLLFGF